MPDNTNQIDIGQAAEVGANVGIEAFFQTILGQVAQTPAGKTAFAPIQAQAFQQMIPYIIIGGLVIWFIVKG
jgi:hypothetical protein